MDEPKLDSANDRLARGEPVSMKSMHDEGAATRNFAVRLHELLTRPDVRDKVATAFLLIGTAIWAYGDLPFVP